MYFTVTQLTTRTQRIAHILTPRGPQAQTTLIRSPAGIRSIASDALRQTNVTDWTLLAVHDESSDTGYYEFIVTLLQQLRNGETVITQLHYHQRLASLLIGIDNGNNDMVYPCTLLEFPPHVNTMAALAALPLRDFILLLPCTVVWHTEDSELEVESRSGSV
jgi:hypothetical protein